MRNPFLIISGLILSLALAPAGRSQNIITVAGGGETFTGTATAMPLGEPSAIVTDSSGNHYIGGPNRILKVDASSGQMSVFAGSSTASSSYSGDGGAAASAGIATPSALALDSAGNVYMADAGNGVIRKVTVSTGIITTVAGRQCTGSCALGDGGLATDAVFDQPFGLAIDAAGNLYISDTGDLVIRVVNTQASSITSFGVTIGPGDINTVAGAGTTGGCTSGNGVEALKACLYDPFGIALDSAGDIYVTGLCTVEKVTKGTTTANSTVSVVAGTVVNGAGSCGYSGDGGAATSAKLSLNIDPQGVAVDSAGNIFIADRFNNVVREVKAGVISTIAGNGSGDIAGIAGFSGDGGAATSAELNGPMGVTVFTTTGSTDIVLIADTGNRRIREVTAGTINTVAGNGWYNYQGNGASATSTDLVPQGVALDVFGNILIGDGGNYAVFRVDSGTGIINAVAGTGSPGYSGDGGPGGSATTCGAWGVAADSAGNVYFADPDNEVIREVTANGNINRFAGTFFGACTLLGLYSGDGGPATSAGLNDPTGVAVDSNGNVFIADAENHRVREVSAATGYISTVAGTGTAGYNGDSTATASQLNGPTGVAVDNSGNLFIADTGNNRIRMVNLKASPPTIATVAGNGTQGYNGDNTATTSELNEPFGVAADGSGNVFIADTGNNRIRKVNLAANTITTVAGDGAYGYNGDGIPATTASLAFPYGVFVDSQENIYVVDSGNGRIREVPAPAVATTNTIGTSQSPSVYGQSVTFTATVSGGSGTPTGSVSFYDALPSATCAALGASTQISATQTLSSGTASVSTSALAVTTHTILGCYSPTGGYSASSGSVLQVVNQASQTILISQDAPSSAVYNTSFTVTATGGGSGNGIVFATVGGSVCSITSTTTTSATVNMTGGTGTCQLTLNQAGDANYSPAPAITSAQTTAQKANQMTPTVTGPPSVTYGTTGTATYTGGNGTGVVTFSVGTSTGCSVSGTSVSVISASGTCSLTVMQAADNNYNAATSAAFPVTLVKANQATLTVTGPANVTYGTTGTATYTGGNGTGVVTFSVGTSAGCSVSGTNVSVTNTNGTCSLTATRAADNNYNAATSAAFPVTLVKANLTITPDGGKSKSYGTPFTAFTGVVNGLVAPDAVTVTYASSGAQTTAAVGSYNITVTTVSFSTGIAANYSITENTALNGLTVYPAPPSQLVFTSTPVTLSAGQCSPAITISSADSGGNISSVLANTQIGLATGSAGGAFYSDSACSTPPVSFVTITSGTNNAVFYYKDTVAGMPTITASSSLTSPTQPETINAGTASQLAISTAPFTIIAGQCSGTVTVTSEDSFGNASTVAGATQVDLSSASRNGTFYSDANCTVQIPPSGGKTFVSIASRSSNAAFHYADTLPGTVTNPTTSITVADDASVLTSGAQPEMILHLSFTTAPIAVTQNQCSGQITLTAENANNMATSVGLAAVLGLGSSSGGGTFYSDNACSTPASAITVPTGTSAANFSYRDSSSGNPSLTASIGGYSVMQKESVGTAPAITSGIGSTFTVTSAGSFTVTTTGSPAPALSESGSLPGAVTFSDNGNGTATISGTPALGTVNSYQITIRATNGVSPDATQVFTLIVQKANQSTLTVTGPGSVTYGTTGAATYTGGSGMGAVTFSAGTSTGCSVSGASVSVNNTNGTCSLTATRASDNNYNTTTSGLFPVALPKAILTVTANNAVKSYGQPNPTFTANFTGFVNGQTPSVLSGSPSLTTTAATSSLPGMYTIAAAVGSLAAANYSFQFVNGTFTINATASVPASGTSCNGAYNGTFQGTLTVSAGQNCIFTGGGVTKNITQTGGNLVLSGATMGGNVQISGGNYSIGPSTVLKANLAINNLPAGPVPGMVCGVHIVGNLQVEDNATAVEIGSSSNSPPCAGNNIGGNLTISGNTAAAQMVGNIVAGSMNVDNNSGPTQVAGNAVKDTLSCLANSDITVSGPNPGSSTILGQCH